MNPSFAPEVWSPTPEINCKNAPRCLAAEFAPNVMSQALISVREGAMHLIIEKVRDVGHVFIYRQRAVLAYRTEVPKKLWPIALVKCLISFGEAEHKLFNFVTARIFFHGRHSVARFEHFAAESGHVLLEAFIATFNFILPHLVECICTTRQVLISY